ncbi:MAG TPA: hypothetical protein VFR67_09445 [Pilimelia sp.]|nr:hypothetical protein [Pilimelia sp.]
MSTQDPHRIDPGTAERLLAGDPVPSRGDARLLADLFAAAAAPARPHEMAGESIALAAFRAAQMPAASRARRAPERRSAVMKMFTVKAAVLATAVAGGVAVAATTVPSTLTDRPHGSSVGSPSRAKPPPDRAGADATDPTARGGESPAGSPSSTPPGQSGSPALDHATIGLCRAYLARPSGAREKALHTPVFAELVTKADGRDVADYCQKLLAGLPASEPTRGPKGQDDGKSPAGRPSKPAGH